MRDESSLLPMNLRRFLRLGLVVSLALAAGACDDVPEVARAADLEPAPTPPIPSLALTAEDTAWLRVEEPDLGAPPETAEPDAVAVEPGEPTTTTAVTADDEPTIVQRAPLEDFPDARFPRPPSVRGLYVNAWAAGSRKRMEALLEVARETEVNSFVIDIKDATGYVSHRTEVELAHSIGATGEVRISDLEGLLDRLEAEGIYPIARIVIVKDPILSAYRPEFAIQDTAGGVWVDSKGIVWLNPYSDEVWRYHVDLAREVAKMGFPEIQWDYVRFPDAPQSDLDRAVYHGREGRMRHEAIRGFLSYARSNLADLPVRTTADVFGVTTTYHRDVGTGQVWEELIDVVDVALPMVYPSHYWPGSFGYRKPNARPYEIVRRALEDALRRSARVDNAGLTRPWLQDFTLGEPIYDGAEVRAQIQATYDAGIDEWVLWNPGSRYTVSALEPVGGFDREPLVRVAGVLAPVSRRHIVMDSVASLPSVPDSTERSGESDGTAPGADSLDVVADSLSAPAGEGDATRPPGMGEDSVRVLPADADSLPTESDELPVEADPLPAEPDTAVAPAPGADTLQAPLPGDTLPSGTG